MTSHKDQIQALINEIDGVLNKPSPRLLSAMAGGTDQQRLVLEQTRSYLASLQRDMAASESPGLTASSAIGYDMASYPEQGGAAESAQQVLQAVLQEMSYLRTNFMQPLRHDVESLQQQRDALAQEVRMLEAQRQQYLLPQQQAANQQQMINEFLQSLMGRLQENLTGQVAQMLTGLEGQPLQGRSLTPGTTIEVEGFPSELPPPYQPMLTPRQRLEQIQMLQTQSDQLLLKLDSTLRVIFESLQSNIQSYQESLTQGLDKMHSLGQQGEAMFAALVNRLAQQLGREASTYLQSSLQSSDWEAAGRPPLPSTVVPTPPVAGSTTFPGEVPLPAGQDEEISDEQIDLLLNELKVSEPVTVIQPPDEDEMMAAINASQSSTAEPPPVVDLESLDLSNLELVQLPPEPTRAGQNAVDVDDDITFFQMDQPLTSFQLDDADFARLQTDLELATSTETVAETEQEIDDIDSALDLLNQLSAELQTEAPTSSRDGETSAEPEEAIAPPPAQEDEMTDLYQSLFGDLAPSFSDDITENLAPEPIDQHIADADLTASPTSSIETPAVESEDALPGDDLFGGLLDPAQAEAAIAPDETESEEPGVLEDLLDGPLFADDTTFEQSATGGEIDAIASLSDLIENPSLDSDADLTEVLNTDSSTSIEAEDTFIPAAPDEVLLVPPQETEEPEPSRSLSLDADTINQLSADLSSLEEFYTSPVSDDADLELTEGANWTLDDLTRQSEEDIAASVDSISLDDDITELLTEGIPSDLSPASSLEADLPSLSPIDHPIPLDVEEPSEITEIIEPTVASAAPLSGSAESQPSEPTPSDEVTPDTLFALDEHDELDLDATPTNLEDLFESLSASPEPSSPAIAETNLPDDLFASAESATAAEPDATATDLTSDDLFAGLEFDQPEPISDSSDIAPDLTTDLTADQADRPPLTETIEGLDDLGLDQLFADVTDVPSESPADVADEADESAGMTLGEFGASLEALPLESEEAIQLDSLFDETDLSTPEELPDVELSNLSLDEFGELLPLPLTTPSPDVTPASAALHAMDTAAPPPPIPLDEEATIDDFFAAATPIEPSQIESAEPSEPPLPSTSAPVETAPAIAPGDEDEANAFTLEGMVDSLFEDAPTIASAGAIDSPESQASVDDAEKKKTLTETSTETPTETPTELSIEANEGSAPSPPTESIDAPVVTDETPVVTDVSDLLTLLESAEAPVETEPVDTAATETPANPETVDISGLDWIEQLANAQPSLPVEPVDLDQLTSELEASFGLTQPDLVALVEQDPFSGTTQNTNAELSTIESETPESASLDLDALLRVAAIATEAPLDTAQSETASSPASSRPDSDSAAVSLDLTDTETRQTEAAGAEASRSVTEAVGSDLDELAAIAPGSLATTDFATEDVDLEELELDELVGDRLPFSESASDMLAVSEELGIDPHELEALLDSDFSTDDFFPPPPSQATIPRVWYLGLDLGTTGISAVLLNRLSGELHPIYWSYVTPPDSQHSSPLTETLFRLPTRVYLSTDDRTLDTSDVAPGFIPQGNLVKVSFVPPTTAYSSNASGIGSTGDAPSDFLLHDFKTYLKLGIPYYSPETSCWEPVLQWSDHHQISLSPIHQALRALMTTLSHTTAPAATVGVPVCGAIGLEEGTLQTAMSQLAGVIVGCPVNWPDTYSFNVREAILSARLVDHPDQIFVVEDVIATLLSGLRSADGRSLVLPNGLAQKPHLHNADWHGPTLAINAGATATDLALVDLPQQLADLSYDDFHLRSLPVAGNAIDQDIVCQLIYPAWLEQPKGTASSAPIGYTFGIENGARTASSPESSNSNHAADTSPLDLSQLGFASLPLPQPGEPDLQNRFRLQQRLESSALGHALLEAARYVKLNLQHQDHLTLGLGDRHLTITRQDLGSRVFLPYIQRLNRELNALLAQTSVSPLGINQVVCTGGTASLGAIARWLREKFPNATIIQDTYSGNRAPSPQDNCLPTCSRIAYGLATLPLHPQVPNLVRQQYSDYFLLLEVLRAFPDEPMPVGGIMQLLERRGINTQACSTHILALLEGHLPPGLVPTAKDAYLLTPESRQNPDYQLLLAAPLFYKQNNQTYRPNYEQWNHFRRYLSTIMASTYQKLTEPLSVSLTL